MESFLALLVSADSGALTVTQKILEEYGVSVKVVGSALAAVPLIKTTKFDLGVFDHDVPGALNLVSGRATSANPKTVIAWDKSQRHPREARPLCGAEALYGGPLCPGPARWLWDHDQGEKGCFPPSGANQAVFQRARPGAGQSKPAIVYHS